MRTIARMILVCAPLFFAACAAHGNDPEPEAAQQGSLLVSWTFNEKPDSAMCDSSKLNAIEIDLADDEGNPQSTFTAPCNVMSASVMLKPGKYRGTTHFVDVTGTTKSVPVQTKDFTLVSDERVNAVVNFQSSDVF